MGVIATARSGNQNLQGDHKALRDVMRVGQSMRSCGLGRSPALSLLPLRLEPYKRQLTSYILGFLSFSPEWLATPGDVLLVQLFLQLFPGCAFSATHGVGCAGRGTCVVANASDMIQWNRLLAVSVIASVSTELRWHTAAGELARDGLVYSRT